MMCHSRTLDKVIRRCIGLLIIGLGFYYKTWLGAIGILPIIMTYTGRCLICLPLNTNSKKNDNHARSN
jgi:hypothetical protein